MKGWGESPAEHSHTLIPANVGNLPAGKSTVREIIGRDSKWSQIGQEAVVIEADAIKSQVRPPCRG